MMERRVVVHLDGMAIVRRAGGGADPDPVAAATLTQLAGADGVAVQLREDRRYIQDRDARVLRQTVTRGFGLDIAPVPEMMKVALEIRPDTVTLTTELPDQIEKGRGVDVAAQIGSLGEILRALEDGKIATAVAVMPDLEQVKAAHRADSRAVRLDASRFAEDGPDRGQELERIADAARLAAKLGLGVAVGGALAYRDLKPLAALDVVGELHVGHAVAARAMLVGLDRAVRELVELAR